MRAVGAALAVMALVGCGTDRGSGADGVLILNNVGNELTAGEFATAEPSTVSLGTGTMKNAGTQPITIVGVDAETFGEIELVDAIVAGPDREGLWISSENTFPPDDADLGTTSSAVGHVIEPGPTGGPFDTQNLILGFEVAGGVEVAGVSRFCVDYRVGDEERVRSQCWNDHRLRVCPDFDAPSCTVPDS